MNKLSDDIKVSVNKIRQALSLLTVLKPFFKLALLVSRVIMELLVLIMCFTCF